MAGPPNRLGPPPPPPPPPPPCGPWGAPEPQIMGHRRRGARGAGEITWGGDTHKYLTKTNRLYKAPISRTERGPKRLNKAPKEFTKIATVINNRSQPPFSIHSDISTINIVIMIAMMINIINLIISINHPYYGGGGVSAESPWTQKHRLQDPQGGFAKKTRLDTKFEKRLLLHKNNDSRLKD